MIGQFALVAEAHTVPERLSFAMGLTYGTVALGLGKYPPRCPSKATRPAEYRKGYEKVKAYYASIARRGPAAQVAIAMQFLAIRKMHGDKAANAIWPQIRDKVLENLHVTRAQYTKWDLPWPPF